MAEATDRPQGAELEAMPGTSSESYRPLSLLALVGFGLAAVYALVVLLGGAVALFNRVPWLMPLWTFLIPIAVVVLCWAARTRIRNSEGALSGVAFTSWGFRLTVVVALLYAVYYSVSFFAVSLQAKDCANQFFEQLKQGRTERAFLFATGVATKDTDDGELRDMLEVRYNAPGGPNGGGAFTRFRQNPFVRAIESSGDDAGIAPLGVADWSYEQGGYRVVLRYQIATPQVEFEVGVETFGRDSKPGEPKGRQWQIKLQNGETGVISSTMKLTPRGEDFMRHGMMAQNFASAWQEKLNHRQWAEVYLDTLKPAERARLRKGRQTARFLTTAPVAGLAPLGLYDTACRDFLNGWPTLSKAKLIHLDDKTFWTSKREREAILKRIEQTFVPGPNDQATFRLQIQNTQMPLSRSAEGEEVFLFDANLMYLDEMVGRPKYVVIGQVAVAADERELDGPPSVWRIQAIEINSGRTPPAQERPGAPGRPGGLAGP